MFKPDGTIFQETTVFNYDTLREHLKQSAFLNKGLKITLQDERVEPNKREEFKYDGGIKEYVEFLNKDKTIVEFNKYISKYKDIKYINTNCCFNT